MMTAERVIGSVLLPTDVGAVGGQHLLQLSWPALSRGAGCSEPWTRKPRSPRSKYGLAGRPRRLCLGLSRDLVGGGTMDLLTHMA
ncbi:MAG: hypothetical protein DMD86_10275 [Candidatus Rokuibacteriota bacterium]|nr:MAG: hypothetical protein DMD86_10275 [Candidatus Rokubacteria bacterium]